MNKHIKSILALAVSSGLTTIALQANPEPGPEPKKEMRPWLGVATSYLEPVLRQHLGLDEGFGVQVTHVPADSPAATAGLKAGDVLTMLDNQILTTPEHLSTLVRAKKKGDAVEVTLLRKGAEQKLSVTLGEHEMPVMDRRHGIPMLNEFSPDQFRRWQEEMQRHHQEFMPRGRMPEPPRFDQPGGREEGRKDKSRHESSRQSMSHSQSTVKINNDHGSVVISQNDGKAQITITDKEGKEIFEGSYDARRGIESLPDKAREHLKEMKVDQIDLLSTPPMPLPVEPKPEKKEPEEAPKSSEVL